MSFLTRNKVDTKEIVQQVLGQLPEAMRSHRMIDLDRPFELNPKPLIQIRDSVIKQGLKRLIERDYFSVCDFDRLCKLARVYPPNELVKTLNALHCVHWDEMEPDVRNQVQQHIIACFIPVEAECQSGGSDEE